MAVSNDLQNALDAYGSSSSAYSDLDDYLMQKPVYDRGARAAPKSPTMSTLQSIQPSTEDMASSQYEKFITENQVADEASSLARQTEIDELRALLQEDLSSSEDAALSQRSDITKSLEGRIDQLRSGIDSETDVLRQSGLDERASLLKQLAAGDERISSAQTEALGSLEDRQGSLIGDLKGRIGSLSTDLTTINDTIDSQYATLDENQRAAADSTQSEINALNDQLVDVYQSADAGKAETSALVERLEGTIGGVKDNLGSLPIDQIQAEIASINDQTAQFQQFMGTSTSEQSALAEQIRALQEAGLTQADLDQALAGQGQSIADLQSSQLTQDAVNQQRQAAIDPIQAQIDALKGSMPTQQNIDVDALRKQITDEIMAGMPAPAATPAPVTVGSQEGQSGIVVEPEANAYAGEYFGSEGESASSYGGEGGAGNTNFNFAATPATANAAPVTATPVTQPTKVGLPENFNFNDVYRGVNVRGIGGM